MSNEPIVVKLDLKGASRDARSHPDQVQPPNMIEVLNLFSSRSDESLTLRPDLIAGSELPSPQEYADDTSFDDFLNSAVWSLQAQQMCYFGRYIPFSLYQNLYSTYSEGTITSYGTKVIEGSGTEWIAYVWGGCWIYLTSDPSTWYYVERVIEDGLLQTSTIIPSVANAEYVIVRTHGVENTGKYTVRKFTNRVIYCAPKFAPPLDKDLICGPFSSNIETEGASEGSAFNDNTPEGSRDTSWPPVGITCPYSASPVSEQFDFEGGQSEFVVSSGAGCPYEAYVRSNDEDWLEVLSGDHGRGGGTVEYLVGINYELEGRPGYIYVGHPSSFDEGGNPVEDVPAGAIAVFTVAQGGADASCTYSLSPTNAHFDANGGTQTISVTATAGCAWSAHCSVDWIVFTSATTGIGNGSVSYQVTDNSSVETRAVAIVVAGLAHTVTQDGTWADNAQIVVGPHSLSITDSVYWFTFQPLLYGLRSIGIGYANRGGHQQKGYIFVEEDCDVTCHGYTTIYYFFHGGVIRTVGMVEAGGSAYEEYRIEEGSGYTTLTNGSCSGNFTCADGLYGDVVAVTDNDEFVHAITSSSFSVETPVLGGPIRGVASENSTGSTSAYVLIVGDSGAYGKAQFSDLTTWTTSTIGAAGDLLSCCYLQYHDIFIAVDDAGAIFSCDRTITTWQQFTVLDNGGSPLSLPAITSVRANRKGTCAVFIDEDGDTWAATDFFNPGGNLTLRKISSGKTACAWNEAMGEFAISNIVGNITYWKPYIGLASPPSSVSNISLFKTYDAASDGTTIVLVGFDLSGSGDHIYTSTDGVTWTQRSVSGGSEIIERVNVNSTGNFVAIDISGDVLTSPDGTTWTNTASLGSRATGLSSYSSFYAISGDYALKSTNNGATWSDISGNAAISGSCVIADAELWDSNGLHYQAYGGSYVRAPWQPSFPGPFDTTYHPCLRALKCRNGYRSCTVIYNGAQYSKFCMVTDYGELSPYYIRLTPASGGWDVASPKLANLGHAWGVGIGPGEGDEIIACIARDGRSTEALRIGVCLESGKNFRTINHWEIITGGGTAAITGFNDNFCVIRNSFNTSYIYLLNLSDFELKETID